jgi:hypothetical protein
MSTDEVFVCAVCSEPLTSVGVLYNGAKVIRILACQNGHFIPTLTPQEHVTWRNLATLGKFSMKLYESDLLPSDQQVLMTRRGGTWGSPKVPNVVMDATLLNKVRPCPFCRSTHTSILQDARAYFLCCEACEVFGPEAAELVNAIDKWNSA